MFPSPSLSRFEGDEAEATDVVLLVVLLLEADDALALLNGDVVPVAHAAVRLHLPNQVVVLVAEPNLVHPVL